MINNIIFDFDGVLVDSEILAGRAFSRYLANINIDLSEQEFSKTYAGNKLVEVVSKLSSRFNIKNQEMFFEDVMKLSHTIYTNDLTAVSGVKYFLDTIDQKKLIGSNSGRQRIIEGLKKVNLNKYFDGKGLLWLIRSKYFLHHNLLKLINQIVFNALCIFSITFLSEDIISNQL